MTATRRALSEARPSLVEAWRAQAAPSPFTHPDVSAAAAAAFGLGAMAWEVDGAWSVAFEKTLGRGPLAVRVLALPPLLPVAAPILATAPSEVDTHRRQTPLDALIGAIARRYAQATFALPASWTDPRPFAFAGWDVEARFTYLVDLPSDVDGWSSGRRQDARTDGYEARVGGRETQPDTDDVTAALRLQSDAYRRKALPFSPTTAQMATLADALHKAGLLRSVVVRQGGEVRAAALFAVAGSRATYWLAGSRPGPAMAVLFAHAFEALRAEGVTTVDLGGANVPGVAEFKRQFGSRLVPTYRVRHSGSRWFNALQALRRP